MLPLNRLLEIGGHHVILSKIVPTRLSWARWAQSRYARESSDTPSINAFCCVAPGVRLSDFAIFATGVF